MIHQNTPSIHRCTESDTGQTWVQTQMWLPVHLVEHMSHRCCYTGLWQFHLWLLHIQLAPANADVCPWITELCMLCRLKAAASHEIAASRSQDGYALFASQSLVCCKYVHLLSAAIPTIWHFRPIMAWRLGTWLSSAYPKSCETDRLPPASCHQLQFCANCTYTIKLSS